MIKDRARVGSRFMLEPLGTRLGAEERRILSELRPSAIMLRKRNFLERTAEEDLPAFYQRWLAGLSTLLDEIKDSVRRNQIIFAIDHEGGRVIRPPEPITRFPYPAYWGEDTFDVSRAISIELRSLGVNLVHAPCVDVHSNPLNPVINERAFGTSVEVVQERTRAYLRAAQATNLLTCAKHFPGHGDTASDSHFALPVLPYTLEQLRARELRPFKEAIDLGVDCVMTAHLMLPKIDPDHIATVSRTLLVTVLREELGFKGVTISDALGMEAILKNIKSLAFARQSIEAQVDLLCLVGPVVTMQDALVIADNLLAAIDESAEYRRAQEQSAARVEALLTRAAPCRVQPLDHATWQRHQAQAARCATHAPFTETKSYIPEGF